MPWCARSRAALCLCALALCGLSGCGFPAPQSGEERAAQDDCREEANRQYNAQHRDALSERDGSDTPFSGATPPPLPSDGLSDRYAFDQSVDTCLKRSAAVPVAGGANQPEGANR
jgi:hypothetical protein